MVTIVDRLLITTAHVADYWIQNGYRVLYCGHTEPADTSFVSKLDEREVLVLCDRCYRLVKSDVLSEVISTRDRRERVGR